MGLFKLTAIAAVTVAIAGCAVSSREISELKAEKTEAAKENMKIAKKQLRQESAMTKIAGNYLGDAPIDLPYAATLPPAFFEPISIRSKGASFGTVAQAAKNIGLATGIAVRINPDVEAIIPGAAQTAMSMQGSVPGMGGPISSMSSTASAVAPNNKQVVKLDYQGPLLTYIKQVANSGGVEWEYRDGAINFYRLVTKSFSLFNVSPGDIDVADSMSKGGQSQTGSTGGSTSNNTGSFSTTSSVGMKGTFSIWKLLKPAIESALSTSGKLAINEATGTVTVTDTKDAVARVEKIVERENLILGRQVSIDVRVIRVDVRNSTQVGINLNAVYSLFNNAGAVINSTVLGAPATQTTAAAGSMTFAVTDPLSRFNNTSIAIQGLNSFGNIVSDRTSTVSTTNRVPAMTGAYTTTGYLAQTTPGAGGAVAGGTGVPGLTPGSVTTGSFLRVLPTIRDNNTVLLNMSVDISDLLGLGSASTGSGQTLQQIQWANTDGTKTTSNLMLNQGEAMVMVGIGSDGANSTAANGVGGASAIGNRNQTMFVIIVTPRIMKGI